MKNSLEKGSVRYIVFREQGTWYAVGLEFNIVESGTTPQEALLLLFEALEGYVETARKVKIRPHVLNQNPDMEYEQLWSHLHNQKQLLRVSQSHFAGKEIFAVGQFALA
jgi:predicted RNase H-like HicB family nuclease